MDCHGKMVSILVVVFYLKEGFVMKKNVGSLDRIIRAIVGVVLLVLLAVTTGWLQIIVGVLGVIMVVTAITGVCPLYIPFKIDTNKKK